MLVVDLPIFRAKLEADDKRSALAIASLLQVDLQIKIVGSDGNMPQATNDTIADDPLLGELMKSGGTITSVEDSQGGLD